MPDTSVTTADLLAKKQEVEQLDTKLKGSTRATEQQVLSELADEQPASDLANQLDDAVKESGPDNRAKIYAVVKNLASSLEKDEEVKTQVNNLVEQKNQNVEQLTGDAFEEAKAQRKELVNQFDAIKNILEMWGNDTSHIDRPTGLQGIGSGRKRGKQEISKHQLQVNETVLADQANSLSNVAKMCGVSTKELKNHLKENGVPKNDGETEFSITSPPEEWSSSLPNGKGTLYGWKVGDSNSAPEKQVTE
jgi:ribosomal protein L17